MAREISSVGVVGLGTMGAGIVEVFAREGFAVVGLEVSPDALERGRGHLEGSTARAVTRGKLSDDDRAALLERVTLTTSYEDLAGCDLVVEAVPELMPLKRAVFAELDRVCKPGAVLATNTSSLSVTDIAVTTSRPADVLGLHFFNPAPVMRLVEVVHTVLTDAAALDAAVELAGTLGKTPVAVADRAGFVANYLLLGYLNRAVRLYESGYVGREELDDAVRLGLGLPMGPLTLLDLIGNDTALEILETMHAQTGDALHLPAPLLRQLVAVGSLGRKAGRGFYEYEAPGSGTVVGQPEPRFDASGEPLPARIGLAGEGPLPDELAALLAAHGIDAERGGADPAGYTSCDVVIEALAADADAQEAFVGGLAGVLDPGAVVLVAGPRGDLTALAERSALRERLLGFHVLEATKRGRLVEVVTALPPHVHADFVAEFAAKRVALGLAHRLGLTAVQVTDRAGYVVGALLFPYLNDAIRMVEQGYAGLDDVDHAMTLGCGYPLGPIRTADLLGLDRVLAMQERIYDEERLPGLAPSMLLRRVVASGRLGRSTGEGFRTTDQVGAQR